MAKIYLDVKYIVKEGKREEFIKKIKDNGIDKASQAEAGCEKYELSAPEDAPNVILLAETWKDKASQKAHGETEHYKKLTEMKAEYVLDVQIKTTEK